VGVNEPHSKKKRRARGMGQRNDVGTRRDWVYREKWKGKIQTSDWGAGMKSMRKEQKGG